MLTLDKRPCRIGNSINTRAEMHGEEAVPAMDIPLVNILLEKSELNDLLGERHAWDCLYETRKGKPPAPVFAKHFKPFQLLAKFKDCNVTLTAGLHLERVVLTESVKLTKLKLEPQIGGLTALSVTVQTPATDSVTALLQYLDAQVDVAIQFGEATEAGEEEQPELDLAPPTSTPVKREKVDIKTRVKRTPKESDGATVN